MVEIFLANDEPGTTDLAPLVNSLLDYLLELASRHGEVFHTIAESGGDAELFALKVTDDIVNGDCFSPPELRVLLVLILLNGREHERGEPDGLECGLLQIQFWIAILLVSVTDEVNRLLFSVLSVNHVVNGTIVQIDMVTAI